MEIQFNEEKSTEVISRPIRLDKEKSKELTGYPSIDRPWYKYFSKDAINAELPQNTLSEFLRTNNIDNLSVTSINYFGKKISYQELFKKINETAQAYKSLGVKAGDNVSLCVPTLPESVYSFYALNELGAISCWIDPRTGSERIKQCVNAVDSDFLVTIDLASPKIDKIIDDTNVSNVVSLSAFQSLPFGLSCLAKGKSHIEKLFGKKGPSDYGYIDWGKFIKNKVPYNVTNYTPNSPASIVYTSGTTGVPKGVVVSNDALNSVAFQYQISGVPHSPGDHFLNIMPAFLLYGLSCGIHMPLCLGMTNIIIPQVDFDKIGDLVEKHKPKFFMVNPILFENIMKSPKVTDLSYVQSPGVGGSPLALSLEKSANEFLAEHNCKNKLGKGWGLTEGGSAVAATLFNECDEFGSPGIPLPKNIVSAFEYSLDEDGEIIRTDNELTYGNEGELCILGPSHMLGYLNNEELTNKMLRLHSDGNVWLHTGDRGYVNENGNVFISYRIGRMIITPDSHNIYLGSIESVLNTHPAVEKCAVVGVKVDGHEEGKLPKAVVVLKDEYKKDYRDVINELIELCNESLPERDVARYYEIVDDLPITTRGKVDYDILAEEVIGEFIDANIVISDLVDEKVLKFTK